VGQLGGGRQINWFSLFLPEFAEVLSLGKHADDHTRSARSHLFAQSLPALRCLKIDNRHRTVFKG
jgi:hypothetical protein